MQGAGYAHAGENGVEVLQSEPVCIAAGVDVPERVKDSNEHVHHEHFVVQVGALGQTKVFRPVLLQLLVVAELQEERRREERDEGKHGHYQALLIIVRHRICNEN